MGNQVEVQTFLKGFEEPLLGKISFRRFEDPALGLEAMNGRGEILVRAVELDGGRKLEATPDVEEIGPFVMEFADARRQLEAFREKRPATFVTKKGEGSYILTIMPQ